MILDCLDMRSLPGGLSGLGQLEGDPRKTLASLQAKLQKLQQQYATAAPKKQPGIAKSIQKVQAAIQKAQAAIPAYLQKLEQKAAKKAGTSAPTSAPMPQILAERGVALNPIQQFYMNTPGAKLIENKRLPLDHPGRYTVKPSQETLKTVKKITKQARTVLKSAAAQARASKVPVGSVIPQMWEGWANKDTPTAFVFNAAKRGLIPGVSVSPPASAIPPGATVPAIMQGQMEDAAIEDPTSMPQPIYDPIGSPYNYAGPPVASSSPEAPYPVEYYEVDPNQYYNDAGGYPQDSEASDYGYTPQAAYGDYGYEPATEPTTQEAPAYEAADPYAYEAADPNQYYDQGYNGGYDYEDPFGQMYGLGKFKIGNFLKSAVQVAAPAVANYFVPGSGVLLQNQIDQNRAQNVRGFKARDLVSPLVAAFGQQLAPAPMQSLVAAPAPVQPLVAAPQTTPAVGAPFSQQTLMMLGLAALGIALIRK